MKTKERTEPATQAALRAVRAIMVEGTPERTIEKMARKVDEETGLPELIEAARELTDVLAENPAGKYGATQARETAIQKAWERTIDALAKTESGENGDES